MRLPIHVGLHYIGSVAEREDGVAMPSIFGPFVECLAEVVDRVTVIACDPPANVVNHEGLTDYVARPSRSNISVLSLGGFGSWRNYRERRRNIERIMSEVSPGFDLIIFRLPNRRAELVYRGTRTKRIVSIALAYEPHFVRAVPFSRKKIVQKLNLYRTQRTLKKIMRASGLVIVNSDTLVDNYKRIAPATRQQWSMRRAAYAFQTTDRFQNGSANFLICCRIIPTKGIFEMLDVFARVRAELLPAAHLHVAGIGESLDELRERAAAMGLQDAVTFHGWVSAGPDLFALFQQTDVLLHLSYAEGLPFVVWEALAHSVLVVSTPVGGLRDFLEDGGEILYAPVGAVDEAVVAVRRLIEDGELRRRMLARGYALASAVSLESVVDDLVGRFAERWPELADTTP